MAKLLVVDDERDLLDLVCYNLELAGHETTGASNGFEAREVLLRGEMDLVVLDVMMPGMSGFQLLEWIRGRAETERLPVILLTARGEEADVLGGFDRGADDYIVKPFNIRELVARVRAVLQRGRGEAAGQRELRFGEGHIDLQSQQVFIGGEEVELAPQEYRLLVFLASHPMRVYTRDALLKNAWDPDVCVDPRTVDVHIRRLRARVEADPKTPALIETVRGSGYRFNPRR